MLLTQVLKGKKKQPKQSALYNTQALFSFPSLLFHHSSAVFTCVRILDRKENCVQRLELFIQLYVVFIIDWRAVACNGVSSEIGLFYFNQHHVYTSIIYKVHT